MADTDEPGQLIPFPGGGDPSYVPPPIASYADTIPPAPPETPEETTMELPVIPAAPDPRAALSSEGFPADADEPEALGESDEGEAGEYVHRRSLADRLGDWIEHRISLTQSRREEEAAFREAEIARKVARSEARSKHEVALAEHNHRLRLARAGKPGGASGLGADKGGKGPGGGGSGGSGGRGPAGGGNGHGKGTGRPSGGGSGAGGSAGPSGGPKGRQNGSGGPGNAGGPGKSGAKGGGTSPGSPASPRQERARGRQERAAARQVARQERRGTRQGADVADRSKDRDQNRQNKQADRDTRRAAKAERAAARKAKREAATAAAAGRTTLGGAVAKEAERRWEKRRKDAKAEKDAAAGAEREKVNLRKDKGRKDGADATAAPGAPGDAASSGGGPKDSPKAGPEGKRRRTWRRPADGTTPPGSDSHTRGRDPFAEPVHTVTYDWPGHEPRPKDGTASVPAQLGTGPRGLPSAPEPHAQRPGTHTPPAPAAPTNPGPRRRQDQPIQEHTVASTNPTTPARSGLAREHQTDITFDDYLMEIANITIGADADSDRAGELADALTKVADALRDMAGDLVGDHNINTQVTTLISDLADASDRMKAAAVKCAEDCVTAAEAARLVAADVARVYGEDMAAMNDAGLVTASAAAHHN